MRNQKNKRQSYIKKHLTKISFPHECQNTSKWKKSTKVKWMKFWHVGLKLLLKIIPQMNHTHIKSEFIFWIFYTEMKVIGFWLRFCGYSIQIQLGGSEIRWQQAFLLNSKASSFMLKIVIGNQACGPVKMPSRARSCPRAVGCRP